MTRCDDQEWAGARILSHEEHRSAKRKMKRHQRDVFHAKLVEGAVFSGGMDLPTMHAVEVIPAALIPFSEAVKTTCTDYDCFVDFYEDDYEIERFWNDPFRYLRILDRFAGCISPDYSTCRDFPVALKAHNVYRNQALGFRMQRDLHGPTIPNVRCEPNLPWMLDGTPRNSIIAIGARSCVKKVDDRLAFVEAVRFAVDELSPMGIVWYGSTDYGVADYPLSLGIPVHVFPARIRG